MTMNKTRFYDNLISDVNGIISQSEKLEVAHENIEPIKKTLLNGLKKHRDIFEKNAIRAKELSEWNKYTIVFFGETNAGKSTIIESLRILGKEKSKLVEYEEIESHKQELGKKHQKFESLEKLLGATLKENENLVEDLHQKNYEYEDLKREITVQTQNQKNNTDSLNEIENNLNSTNEEIKDLENRIHLLDNQKQSILNEIVIQEQRIQKKEKSFIFRIWRWSASVFGKDMMVGKEYLSELKENEFEIQQSLNELQDNLSTLSVHKEDITNEIRKANNQIQKYHCQLKKLAQEDRALNDKINHLNVQIKKANDNIENYKTELKECHNSILQIESRLNTLGDGKIIGTGRQDFTVDVISYELEYNNQPVILIDVPGIEGDEEKYTEMIENAVSRAHAIFYVNGSNKKPEEKTLEKIKSYLQDQTEVFSISNVRGKADSYEFEDERILLNKTHKSLNKTVELTKDTLSEVLDDRYKGHLNIQGLLAFIATSKYIFPERKDFVRDSVTFYEHFKTSKVMKDFSNISSMETLIINQQPFFKSKIKVANLQTIIGIASRFTEELKDFQNTVISDEKIKQVEREINNYQNEVKTDLLGLENSFRNISNRLANQYYNQFQSFLHHIIDKEFDKALGLLPHKNGIIRAIIVQLKLKGNDKESIEKFIKVFSEQLVVNIQITYQKNVQSRLGDFFENLENKKKRVSSRLRVINKTMIDKEFTGILEVDFGSLTKGFNYKDILMGTFGLVTTVGGMALTGSLFGPIGTIIGAVIGGIIYAIKLIFGGESREAKLKRELEPKLVEAKKNILSHFEKANNQIFQEVKATTSQERKSLDLSLKGLRELQIALISKINGIELLNKTIIREKETIESTYINSRLN